MKIYVVLMYCTCKSHVLLGKLLLRSALGLADTLSAESFDR